MSKNQKDLSQVLDKLPKVFCIKIALETKLQSLKVVSFVLLGLLITTTILWQKEKSNKSYIFAGTLSHFQEIRPNEVPRSYVDRAIKDYARVWGNTNYREIEEDFQYLYRHMHPEFRQIFFKEAKRVVERVIDEKIIYSSVIKQYKLKSDGNGKFLAHILLHKKINQDGVDLKPLAEVLVINLKFVPPTKKLRWFLSITSFKSFPLNEYKVRCKECLIN